MEYAYSRTKGLFTQRRINVSRSEARPQLQISIAGLTSTSSTLAIGRTTICGLRMGCSILFVDDHVMLLLDI